MTENGIVIEDNLKLVHSLCRRFTDKGIDYDDLFQAGCMGLVKAAKGFDETRGYMFSTYAVPLILGEMRRLFRENGTVKLSRGLKERSVAVSRAVSALIEEKGSQPRLSEIALKTGLSAEDVTEALDASRPVISLSAQFSDDDGQGTEMQIPSGESEEKLLEDIALKSALSRLDAEDRQLVFLRYYSGKTQSETAALLGKTQVWVSRREKRIIDTLRRNMT